MRKCDQITNAITNFLVSFHETPESLVHKVVLHLQRITGRSSALFIGILFLILIGISLGRSLFEWLTYNAIPLEDQTPTSATYLVLMIFAVLMPLYVWVRFASMFLEDDDTISNQRRNWARTLSRSRKFVMDTERSRKIWALLCTLWLIFVLYDLAMLLLQVEPSSSNVLLNTNFSQRRKWQLSQVVTTLIVFYAATTPDLPPGENLKREAPSEGATKTSS